MRKFGKVKELSRSPKILLDDGTSVQVGDLIVSQLTEVEYRITGIVGERLVLEGLKTGFGTKSILHRRFKKIVESRVV